jgi:hypothetical protein
MQSSEGDAFPARIVLRGELKKIIFALQDYQQYE